MTLLLKSVKTFTIEQVKQAAANADFACFDHLMIANPLVPYGLVGSSFPLVNWSELNCLCNYHLKEAINIYQMTELLVLALIQ